MQVHYRIGEKHLAVMLHVVADTTNFPRQMHDNVRSPANPSTALWIGQVNLIELEIVRAFFEEAFSEMRADKPTPTSDHDSFLAPERHIV